MPSCAVKWCISQTRFHNRNVGVSFHIFPVNPKRKELWTKAVRLERQDNEWNPNKHTKICSIHFANDDFYVSKKGNTMLKTNAVPICTTVGSIIDPETTQPRTFVSLQNVINSKPNAEMTSKSRKRNLVACPSCGCKFVPVDSAKENHGTSNEMEVPNTRCSAPLNVPSSEIQSAIVTPKTHGLKKNTREKVVLSKKILTKIRNLRRQNERLLKKCISLKNIATALKKGDGETPQAILLQQLNFYKL